MLKLTSTSKLPGPRAFQGNKSDVLVKTPAKHLLACLAKCLAGAR